MIKMLGIVHTYLENLSNENGAFRKLSLNRRNWKRYLFVEIWIKNVLKTQPFVSDDVTIIIWSTLTLKTALKRWRHDNHVIYPNPQGGTRGFLSPVDCCVFKFFRRSLDRKLGTHFHSETLLSDFSDVVCKGGIRHFYLKLTPDNAFGIFLPKPTRRLRLPFLPFPISEKRSDIRSVTSYRWK